MVEWSITVVLKTTVLRGTGGSNPSLSAKSSMSNIVGLFFCVFKFYVDKKVTFRLAIHYFSGGEKLLFMGRKVAFYPFAPYLRNG